MNPSSITKLKNNPPAVAQIDIQVLQFYTDGTTIIAPGAIPAAQQVREPVFLFGQSDFDAGFVNGFRKFPVLSGWTYNVSLINGQPIVATFTGLAGVLELGDLVFEYFVPGAPPPFFRYIVVRAKETAYGSLLASLRSDTFVTNDFRYAIGDIAQVDQYNNSLGIIYQDLFGKEDFDSLSPLSFKNPEQFQNGIVDVPLNKMFNKHSEIALYLNYDVAEINFSIFVEKMTKIL